MCLHSKANLKGRREMQDKMLQIFDLKSSNKLILKRLTMSLKRKTVPQTQVGTIYVCFKPQNTKLSQKNR